MGRKRSTRGTTIDVQRATSAALCRESTAADVGRRALEEVDDKLRPVRALVVATVAAEQAGDAEAQSVLLRMAREHVDVLVLYVDEQIEALYPKPPQPGELMTRDEAHQDCSSHDPCEAGDPGTCPREPARKLRREAMVGAWSKLETRREGSGLRHYLDGQPVHCGEGIEPQAVERRFDADGNEYTAVLPHGQRVRYEASIGREAIRATLHTGVAGHEFVAAHEPWMRFRWPPRR